jgi:1,4-alpha-glucan branching enzyme
MTKTGGLAKLEKESAAPATRGQAVAELDKGAIEAIVSASHGDPFAVLGPHEIAPGLWEIRAILPGAEKVEALAVSNGAVLALFEKRHLDGFFIARLSSQNRPHYRLRIKDRAGERLVEDPYAFGSALAGSDLAAIRDRTSDAFYRVLGAHCMTHGGCKGVRFTVWAPNAHNVSVVGDFNGWDGRCHPMRLHHACGLWELFVPGLEKREHYKFEIKGPSGERLPLKADPVAFATECPPSTASVTHGLPAFDWHDDEWIIARGTGGLREKPVAIYECHLGSWTRVPEDNYRSLSYRELAEQLVPYVRDLGFTHIELLPITEFPFDGSWGYQPVSLFAPTSRFGTPEDFAFFVEAAHEAGLGIILDWVPGHFPNDVHGLSLFDGTHLYEHADPRQGFHQDWGTYIYNYGREEVAAFLVTNARFWLEQYHLDGLRVDAVASMLYLDYSRRAGEWIPNRFGGNENLEAIDFLRHMNEIAYQAAPGVVTIAEESTAWPGVSRPTYAGGLGFGFKWNMGWMHDTLRFMSNDPIHRSYHHHDMTFGLLYAFSENFILPLSHDEVVHGKGSLLAKMPGDTWQRFANLRAYFGFMWAHPGKKLLFMGGEFAQTREWNHDTALDWHLLDEPDHRGVQILVRDLNALYRATPPLYERDCEASGFRWIVGDDRNNSVFAFARFGETPDTVAIAISNFTPVPRENYRIGVPLEGFYREAVNTDAALYGGSNMGNLGGLYAEAQPSHGEAFSISLTLPPLATVILIREP